MSAAHAPASDACPSSKSGLAIEHTVLVTTIGFGLFELFVLVVALPKFEVIFNGLLRELHRPRITEILLDLRWAFVALTGLWMFSAILSVQRRTFIGWTCAILAVLLIQLTYTVVALFLPLTITIQTLQ